MNCAVAAAIGVAALAIAGPVAAEGNTYQGPGYSYTHPPYSYQPPPYSYTPPAYTYQPPGYVYTPPGQYRRQYRLNDPDYNKAYQTQPSAYRNPDADRYQQNLRDPYNDRIGNPRHSRDVWTPAPPFESSPR